MKVGFIGLGRMGQGMARRILDAGHDLAVYNRTPDKCTPLGEAGAAVAPSVAALCEDREVVITMLANDDALEDVARRDDGLIAALPSAAIHVAMGTHGVGSVRGIAHAHAEAGQGFVAGCPQGGQKDCGGSIRRQSRAPACGSPLRGAAKWNLQPDSASVLESFAEGCGLVFTACRRELG